MVVGLLQQDAIDRLTNNGFKVEVIQEDQNPDTCDQDIGRVCRQTPADGARISKGSTVTIYVAQQPQESPTPIDTTTESPSPSPSPS